jgi:putative ABC transport system ATP-binding protein
MSVVQVANIHKHFDVAGQEVQVLKDISFEINEGDFAIIYGPSGSGKSTILHAVLGLEAPSSGSVTLLGTQLYKDQSEDVMAEFRKNHVGMVYQQPNWVKAMSVVENVMLPLDMLGLPEEENKHKALSLLNAVHMVDWEGYHPAELSSGQQQRVSLARAMVTDPEIIIADEPTGNLDYEAGLELIGLLQELNKKTTKALIMVTHNLEYLQFANKAINIFDGQIKEIFNPQTEQHKLKELFMKRVPYM